MTRTFWIYTLRQANCIPCSLRTPNTTLCSQVHTQHTSVTTHTKHQTQHTTTHTTHTTHNTQHTTQHTIHTEDHHVSITALPSDWQSHVTVNALAASPAQPISFQLTDDIQIVPIDVQSANRKVQKTFTITFVRYVCLLPFHFISFHFISFPCENSGDERSPKDRF